MEKIQNTTIRKVMNIKTFPPYLENFNLLKLMRMTSPTLPIGAYSYSQALEFAITSNGVYDASSSASWIQGLLEHSFTYLDLPILERLYRSWLEKDIDAVIYWNRYLLASRDARELQEEDLQLGKAFARLLADLELREAEQFIKKPCSFVTLYSLAAVSWEIFLNNAAHGFLWMWAENQVLCAMKLIPLGQTEGQKILSQMIEIIPRAVSKGLALADEDIGFTVPGQGIASALHETQYTRLFRS